MRQFALLMLALVGVASSAQSSMHHKVYRIRPENKEQLQFLRRLNEDEGNDWTYWRDPSTISKPADLLVSPTKQFEFNSLMKSHGIAYETLIDNVEQLLAKSAKHHKSRRDGRIEIFDWTRYQNLEEIYAWMDTLAKEFPSIVNLQVGGHSGQGREIRGVKLSFTGGDEKKPGIFIEGGIHAREWISPATVTYLIDQLLRSNDTQIRTLAKAHDWYLFPVFNPDGYAHTHVDPEDIFHRFWRKTRSSNHSDSICQGTDLNRNWGFQWNFVGSSSDPCSHIYAGSSPFSTVEAKSLSEYINSISNKLFAYISFHSYSQVLMFPYGHTKTHVDNYEEQLAIAKASVGALSRRYGTKYETGSTAETIGLASGGSADWAKSSLKLPLVYIYELRDQGEDYGFLLPPDQIIPNGQEVLDSLVALFQEAKRFGYPRK